MILSIKNNLIYILLMMLLLIPSTYAIASEIGGYVSEKLIERSGTSDSSVVVERSGTDGEILDIGQEDIDGVEIPAGPYTPQTSLATQRLAQFLAVLFVLIIVLGGMAYIALAEVGIAEIIIFGIILVIALAGLRSIQDAIAAFLGG